MGLLAKYFAQTKKPEGILGRLMIGGMNGGHAKLADWGMSLLPAISPANIVELGCGGGRNAGALLSRYPGSHLAAIDHSGLSVERSKEYNAAAIKDGRCAVMKGDVSKLDLPDGAYDLATAFETVYFWPGIEKCFAEVCRVLRTGGTFLIVNESDGTDETGRRFEKIIDGMKCYTEEQLTAALKAAGFGKVRAYRNGSKPWLAVLAVK
ncbi:MAG: class I SAM-dependent methyltransferase [Clostridiales bacterium]|nr:class I SAM-dependent methyltransferase [Clostridiales bacterium]